MSFGSFLTGLVGAALPIATQVLSGGALGGVAAALPIAQSALQQQQAGATASALGITPAQIAANQAAAAAGVTIGGGMKNKVVTKVQTFNPAGVMIKEKILPGSPFLMRTAFVNLTKTMKLIRVAKKKLPSGRSGAKQDEKIAQLEGLIQGIIASGDHHGHAALALTQLNDG